ncbi:MAG: PRC-barrel domain-containing protein [Candidatus Nitrotoga sp. SPKER]|nr:MAG: PRC-barrel domain-containing protein [Candidatus Nitrotoga sp. SPKER]
MANIDTTYSEVMSNDDGPGPEIMGGSSLIGNDVYNHSEEDLGEIKEIMLDMESGEIAYAVLSFGGILSIGEKLFAIPWDALTLDTENKRFILDVDKSKFELAEGFDQDNWPTVANYTWRA